MVYGMLEALLEQQVRPTVIATLVSVAFTQGSCTVEGITVTCSGDVKGDKVRYGLVQNGRERRYKALP
jgi:hypothetical protein